MNKLLLSIIKDTDDSIYLEILFVAFISLPASLLLILGVTIVMIFLTIFSPFYSIVHFLNDALSNGLWFVFPTGYFATYIFVWHFCGKDDVMTYARNTEFINYLRRTSDTLLSAGSVKRIQNAKIDVEDEREDYKSVGSFLEDKFKFHYVDLGKDDSDDEETVIRKYAFLVIPKDDIKLLGHSINMPIMREDGGIETEQNYYADIKYFTADLDTDKLKTYTMNYRAPHEYFNGLVKKINKLYFVTEINGTPVNLDSIQSKSLKEFYEKAGERNE